MSQFCLSKGRDAPSLGRGQLGASVTLASAEFRAAVKQKLVTCAPLKGGGTYRKMKSSYTGACYKYERSFGGAYLLMLARDISDGSAVGKRDWGFTNVMGDALVEGDREASGAAATVVVGLPYAAGNCEY